MTIPQPSGRKDLSQLAHEWDSLAIERHRQIKSGEDVSYDHVLVPEALSLISEADRSVVLDVGSGTGDFTARLAALSGRVIGVEPSSVSVAVAREACADLPNVSFLNQAVEDAVDALVPMGVTSAVALMSLMSAPDLPRLAAAMRSVLAPGGVFAAIITHPCYWPIYWKYADAPWFNYSRETFVEAPFAISRCETEITTTHIHRPISSYVNVFTSAGFRLDHVSEPIPTDDVQGMYPNPNLWPRFFAFRWRSEN
jgi:SAM-dependent methyltransferase